MTSEIVILITELRNKQRITLPAGSYRFGRSAQCEYVLRRNNVGDHQFTVSFAVSGASPTAAATTAPGTTTAILSPARRVFCRAATSSA